MVPFVEVQREFSGKTRTYRLADGTFYDGDTPEGAIRAIEDAKRRGVRIHVHHGDLETGKDWLEEFSVQGYVGRTGGSIKAPLLVHNSRSMGGHIISGSVVKVRETKSGRVLYQHPKYHHGVVVLREMETPIDRGDNKGVWLRAEALVNGSTHARFEYLAGAVRWAKKLGLEYALAEAVPLPKLLPA